MSPSRSGSRARAFWTRWTIVGVAVGAACVILVTFGLVTLLSKNENSPQKTSTVPTTSSTPTPRPVIKAEKTVSLMFYAGPSTHKSDSSRHKRSSHFDESNPTTKDAIYDALEHWDNETKTGKTAFQLIAYTDKVVTLLPLSQSVDDLKKQITDLYDDNGDFSGEPSQTAALNVFKSKMAEMRAMLLAADSDKHMLMLMAPEKLAYSSIDSMQADIKAAGAHLKELTGDLTRTIIVGVTLSADDMKGYGVDSSSNAETISADDGDIIDKIEHSIDIVTTTTGPQTTTGKPPSTVKSTVQPSTEKHETTTGKHETTTGKPPSTVKSTVQSSTKKETTQKPTTEKHETTTGKHETTTKKETTQQPTTTKKETTTSQKTTTIPIEPSTEPPTEEITTTTQSHPVTSTQKATTKSTIPTETTEHVTEKTTTQAHVTTSKAPKTTTEEPQTEPATSESPSTSQKPSTTSKPPSTTSKPSTTQTIPVEPETTEGVTSTVKSSTKAKTTTGKPTTTPFEESTEGQTTEKLTTTPFHSTKQSTTLKTTTELPTTFKTTTQTIPVETSSQFESTEVPTTPFKSTKQSTTTEVFETTEGQTTLLTTEKSTERSTKHSTTQTIPVESTRVPSTLKTTTEVFESTEGQTTEHSTTPVHSSTHVPSTLKTTTQTIPVETSTQFESTERSTTLKATTQTIPVEESTEGQTTTPVHSTSVKYSTTQTIPVEESTEGQTTSPIHSTSTPIHSTTLKTTTIEYETTQYEEGSTEHPKLNERVSLAFYNGPEHFASRFRRHRRSAESTTRQQAADLEQVIHSWSDRFDNGLEVYFLPYAAEPAEMSSPMKSVDEAIQFVRNAYANPPQTSGQDPSQERAIRIMRQENEWIHAEQLGLKPPPIAAYRSDTSFEQDSNVVKKLFEPNKLSTVQLIVV